MGAPPACLGPGVTESRSWLADASDSASSSRPWRERQLCRGQLRSWVRNGGNPSPTPEAAFQPKGIAGEGSLEALESPDPGCKTFATLGTCPGGEGSEASAPITHFPVCCPLQPGCGSGGGRRSRGRPKEKRRALHFLPMFVTYSFAIFPRGTESRRDWWGRQTWMGTFSSGER